MYCCLYYIYNSVCVYIIRTAFKREYLGVGVGVRLTTAKNKLFLYRILFFGFVSI